VGSTICSNLPTAGFLGSDLLSSAINSDTAVFLQLDGSISSRINSIEILDSVDLRIALVVNVRKNSHAGCFRNCVIFGQHCTFDCIYIAGFDTFYTVSCIIYTQRYHE
jgi:hypothetical protein